MFIEQVDVNEERVLIKTTLDTMGTVHNVNFRKIQCERFHKCRYLLVLVQFNV